MNLRRYPEWGDTMLGIALDETTTRADIVALWRVFANDGQALPDLARFERGIAPLIPEGLRRTLAVPDPPGLQPPSQRDRDAALPARPRRQGPRARPLDDPARLVHDEAERDQRDDPDHLAGVREHPSVRARRSARRLRRAARASSKAWLCEATGYAGVSLQPNAGSQGEYAGLLAIRAWHAVARRGAAQRSA